MSRKSRLPTLSDWSTPAVEPALWFARDFVVGTGCAVLQPATERVVLLYDSTADCWLLPRGRKDVGESIEAAVLREAYEESGYRAELLPLLTPTRAPRPWPKDGDGDGEPAGGGRAALERRLSTEPIYVAVQPFKDEHQPSRDKKSGGEYLCFYFVAQIGPDAVEEQNTRMPNEQMYTTHLLPFDDALQILSGDKGWPTEYTVVKTAIALWRRTKQVLDSPQNYDDGQDGASTDIDRGWETDN